MHLSNEDRLKAEELKAHYDALCEDIAAGRCTPHRRTPWLPMTLMFLVMLLLALVFTVALINLADGAAKFFLTPLL